MIRFQAVPITLDAAAADDAPRTITGIAVPWDVTATVMDGTSVMFKRGAFDVNQKPAKLIENHDLSQLRGTVPELVDLEEGLGFTAQFARTRAADDAVELVKAGAYDAVSVGARPVKFKYDKNGTMIVSQADLVELSLVAVPAFAEAVITEIAASEPDDDENPTPTVPEEETQVSEEIKAEAPAPATIPTSPIVAAAPRAEFTLPSLSEYMSKFLQGGSEWAEFNARIRAAAPNVVTSDLDGVVPEIWTQQVYNNFRGLRPVIDAIGTKAMPAAGKIFVRPKVTTHVTIGESNGENIALDSGTFVVDDLPVTKKLYGGYVKVSEESIDWSSPEVIGLILDDMARIYAYETDNVAADDLVAGATTTRVLSNANLTDPAKWVEWVYGAASTILTASNGNLPGHLFVAPDQFANLGKLVDTTGRALFPQVGPMNAFGTVQPGSTESVAFGLRVVVDRNFAAGTLIAGNADGFEIFEQQKGAIQAEANDGSLSRTIAFRGYLATLMIDASKFVKRVAA